MNSYRKALTTTAAIGKGEQKINENLPKTAKMLGANGLATHSIGSEKTQAVILISR